MNNEETLLSLGFERAPEWDWHNPTTEHYKLEKGGEVFRAYVCRANGPDFVVMGVVCNELGHVDMWRHCISDGSVSRKIGYMIDVQTDPA